MNVHDFEIFLTATRVQNLHRTADERGVTQSAVSKAIARLERRYEVRLFDRGAHGVTLTPDGLAMRECAERLRATLGDIDREMQARKYGVRGTIRLGSVPGMMEPVIVPVVTETLARRGAIRYSINARFSPELYREVEAGQLDLALVVHVDPMPAALGYQLITSIEKTSYQVVARKGHPAAAAGAGLESLAGQQWILPPSQVPHRQWLDRMLADLGLPPADVYLETDAHPFSTARLVRRSDLLTVLPSGMLRFPALKDLAVLDLGVVHPKTRLAIIWRKDAYQSPLVHIVRASLLRQLEAFHSL
ncbi:LysR family transcriptional regulator [Variovorax sp.]|uniref:LysR family transcriptional regulator n=1 Tax=Variovorax sp. TaxID=1871043 RepID=UPI002D435058|nr:LysR family transcriptional regulator [Variovorax sp.]HYP84176.1 LysR family transcriptional regulator [Variovorax sp.]